MNEYLHDVTPDGEGKGTLGLDATEASYKTSI